MATVCVTDWQAVAGFAQAAATLVAGTAAVIGAVWIGRKQTTISAKQTEIQVRQVALQELTLRHDLYDRRYKVFEAVRNFLAYVYQERTLPPVEVQKKFAFAQVESVFLFPPSVYAKITEVQERTTAYLDIIVARVEGRIGQELTQDEADFIAWLEVEIHELQTTFGTSLSMTQLG